jgi:hypothetical protein
MWISWIPRGSGAPGLMTGSAGTAMDVLVTCFSKKGGGSGRRGCKYSAQVGVRGIRGIPLQIFLFLVSHFLQMSLKHSACHTFRASGHLHWAPFGDSFLSPGTCFLRYRGG